MIFYISRKRRLIANEMAVSFRLLQESEHAYVEADMHVLILSMGMPKAKAAPGAGFSELPNIFKFQFRKNDSGSGTGFRRFFDAKGFLKVLFFWQFLIVDSISIQSVH